MPHIYIGNTSIAVTTQAQADEIIAIRRKHVGGYDAGVNALLALGYLTNSMARELMAEIA